jgi:hypothetical protein
MKIIVGLVTNLRVQIPLPRLTYGTIWITNNIENRKIKKDAKIPDGWSKGRK